MDPIFDNRDALRGQPAMHALIAGVSRYRHLPGGDGPPASDTLDLRQLGSTSRTALRMYHWLLANRDHLAAPLASVRLLLSPGPEELAGEPEPAPPGVPPCSRVNFVRAVNAWRNDLRAQDEDSAFFYFAGHGVERTTNGATLLMQDFGDPDAGGLLTNTVAFDNLFAGMAPAQTPPGKVARRQFFFIDTCRVQPKKFRRYASMDVPGVWDVELNDKDERAAPVFFAAMPGAKAYALAEEQTLFSKALCKCLEGAAGTTDGADANGQNLWIVSVFSLASALSAAIKRINQEFEAEQGFVLEGLFQDAPILRLHGPPPVSLRLEVEPSALGGSASIAIDDFRMATVVTISPLVPQPYYTRLPAGVYLFRAETLSPRRNHAEMRMVAPPDHAWIANLSTP